MHYRKVEGRHCGLHLIVGRNLYLFFVYCLQGWVQRGIGDKTDEHKSLQELQRSTVDHLRCDLWIFSHAVWQFQCYNWLKLLSKALHFQMQTFLQIGLHREKMHLYKLNALCLLDFPCIYYRQGVAVFWSVWWSGDNYFLFLRKWEKNN